MFKKIISCFLLVLALAMPALICGCEKPSEYHSSYQRESTTPVDQHEVVH